MVGTLYPHSKSNLPHHLQDVHRALGLLAVAILVFPHHKDAVALGIVRRFVIALEAAASKDEHAAEAVRPKLVPNQAKRKRRA